MKNEIYHHGILGQKWGVRRFQNEDGSLTPAGKERYRKSDGSLTRAGKKAVREFNRNVNKHWIEAHNRAAEETSSIYARINERYKDDHFDARFSSERGQ